MWKIRVKW